MISLLSLMIFIPSSYWPLTGHVTEQTDDLALRTKEKKRRKMNRVKQKEIKSTELSLSKPVSAQESERTDLYCHEEKELTFRSFHIGITPGFVSFK